MEHSIWTGYPPGAGHAFAEDQEGLAPEALEAVLVGRPLREPPPEARVSALSPGKLPDVMGSAFHALIVTPRVRKVLEAHAPDGLQFLPARLPRGGERFVLNATASVPALDRARSRYETYPGTRAMRTVRRLALREVPADAPALFHLEEVPQLLLVSPALRAALEEASDTPGEFEHPRDFRLGVFEDDDEDGGEG